MGLGCIVWGRSLVYQAGMPAEVATGASRSHGGMVLGHRNCSPQISRHQCLCYREGCLDVVREMLCSATDAMQCHG